MSDISFSLAFPHEFAPLAAHHRKLREALKKNEDQKYQELNRQARQTTTDVITTMIREFGVVQCTVATTAELYLELHYDASGFNTPGQREVLESCLQICSTSLIETLKQAIVTEFDVTTLALLFQVMHYEAEEAEANQRADFLKYRDQLLDAICEALEEPLTKASARWVRSWEDRGYFDDTQTYQTWYRKANTLAMIGASYICEKLHKLDLDPHNNVPALLVRIAIRGISHQYKDLYKQLPVPAKQLERMLLADIEAYVVATLTIDDRWAAFWSYVNTELSPGVQIILHRRWEKDPPIPYSAIVEELHTVGVDWDTGRAMVEHRRALDKVAIYLRSLNLDGYE